MKILLRSYCVVYMGFLIENYCKGGNFCMGKMVVGVASRAESHATQKGMNLHVQ